MPILIQILLATLVAGVLSALVASFFLVLPARWRDGLLPHLVSFAIGVQLATAFGALMPHALVETGVDGASRLGLWIVLGILLFFLLEKLVLWHHGHGHPEHLPAAPTRGVAARMVMIGDGIHNLVHGVIIGAGFLTDPHLGLVLTVAVLAHEIPQEMGDVAILVNSGMRRMAAFLLNVAVGFTCVVGGLVAFLGLDRAHAVLPYILALAIANLTYVAAADLIPDLHEHNGTRASLTQAVLIALGIVLVFAVKGMEPGA
ncbi:MAG: ZIP family metal transporter [Gammaproteobacteria bacterium]